MHPSTPSSDQLNQMRKSQAESIGKHYLSTTPLLLTLEEALAPPLPSRLPQINLTALTPRQATEHDLLKWRWTSHKVREFRIELEQYDDDIAGRKEAITRFGDMVMVALFGENWFDSPNCNCTPSFIYAHDTAPDDPFGYDYGFSYSAWGRKQDGDPFVHPSKPPAGTKLESYNSKKELNTLELSETALKLLKAGKKSKADGVDSDEDSDSEDLSDDDPRDWRTGNPYFFDPYVEPDDMDYGLDYEYDPEYGYYDGYAEEHSDAYNEVMYDAMYAKSWGDTGPFDAMHGGEMGSSGGGIGLGQALNLMNKHLKGKDKKRKKRKKGTVANAFTPYEKDGWTVIYDANRANGEGSKAANNASAKKQSVATTKATTPGETGTPNKKEPLTDPSTPKKPAIATLANLHGLNPTPTSIASVGLGLAASPSSLKLLSTPLSAKSLSTSIHPLSKGKQALSSRATPSSKPSSSSNDASTPPKKAGEEDKANLGKRKERVHTASSSSSEKPGGSAKPVKKKPAAGGPSKADEGKKPSPAMKPASTSKSDDYNKSEAKASADKSGEQKDVGKTAKLKGEAKAQSKTAKPKTEAGKPKQQKIKYVTVVYKKSYLPSKRPWRDCWHHRGYV